MVHLHMFLTSKSDLKAQKDKPFIVTQYNNQQLLNKFLLQTVSKISMHIQKYKKFN